MLQILRPKLIRVTALAALAAAVAPDLSAQAAAQRPAARAALKWTAPVGAGALNAALGSLVGRSVVNGRWGAIVVSLSRGDTLINWNPDAALLPASTMKVFTSAMALDYLGPAHQFETQVLREGVVDEHGVLYGDLVLRGAGDPSLGTPSDADALRLLAREVAASGVRRVTGAVIGDGSAFDGRRIPDGWRDRYLGASYAARVSALSYRGNLVSVSVRPVAGKAQVTITPNISGVTVTNAVTVRAEGTGAAITVRQDSVTGAFRVGGWIGAKSPARGYSYVVENPELFVAAAFRAALTAQGVTVDGRVAARPANPGAVRMAGFPSRPLSDLVAHMNGKSNNHFAELLFRNVAASTGSIGSADSGNAPTRDLFAADGSGLSTLDRVTPRALVGVLDYSSKAPWAPVFEASLPVAGRSETLRSRMRGEPAQDRLRAKTGTTGEVTSLGGYVTTMEGEELAFAFIYNGPELARARQAIDAMGSTLAAFLR
jgi:D-alanyl-D-alanine carboxypeptidase/D-alanyl-D-alanine-endopeptidase (penicillin-binding protein 4)